MLSDHPLIVALDVPSPQAAMALVEQLGDDVATYKIGLELVFAGGLSLIPELRAAGKGVFLDVKLLDISNTVERAVAQIAGLGVDLLTLHAVDRKTVAAAVSGQGAAKLGLLGVTVMTHLNAEDLANDQLVTAPIEDVVMQRAAHAIHGGCRGVVASALEAAALRAAFGPEPLIVTPGIRPAGGDAGDQQRVTTPAAALQAGASHLVVGRPITQADNPAEAAAMINAQIAAAARSSAGQQ
ncbi:MAG: orotidine-5'-phosphate decarboxylase [Pseudomonadota bacterium]